MDPETLRVNWIRFRSARDEMHAAPTMARKQALDAARAQLGRLYLDGDEIPPDELFDDADLESPRVEERTQAASRQPASTTADGFSLATIGATLFTVVMVAVTIFSLAAAQEGIHELTRWGMFGQVAGSLASLLFPPVLVCLALYGMIEGWDWHWYWAVLFFVWPTVLIWLSFAGIITLRASSAAADGIKDARQRSTVKAEAARRANLLKDLASLSDDDIEELRRMRNSAQTPP